MDYSVGDGYIFVENTQDCFYEVSFENWLAPSPTVETALEHETLQMLIVRGYFDAPDEVFIFDTATKVSYYMLVEDKTTGTVCIPHPMLG